MARQPRRLAGIGAADIPDAAAFDNYVGPPRELTVDPARGLLRLHDGSTPGGMDVAGGGGTPDDGSVTFAKLADELKGLTQTVSANTTLTVADRNKIISVDASAAARTIVLPAAADAGAGFSVKIRLATGPNFVTVDGAGADTINGASTYVMRLAGQVTEFYCDGAAWSVISECGNSVVGSNANGFFRKLADGTLECWNDTLGGLTTEDPLGSVWRSATAITWTFPHAFLTPPVVTPVADHNARWVVQNAAPTASSVVLRHLGTVSNATAIGTRARAVGRWV